MTISEKIAQLEKELQDKQVFLAGLKEAAKKFPDLSIGMDSWGREQFRSKSANALVDQAYIFASCRCCPDAALNVWPHILILGVPIFSDPYRFQVGRKNATGCGSGAPVGTKVMKEANINQVVIDQVEKYLLDNPAENYPDDGNDETNGL